jgi:hypothetical protein
MLLAAILLVIGFVALAGLVTRANEAASQTTRTQDSPFLLEVEQLAPMVDQLVPAMKGNYTDGTADFHAQLKASLDVLVQLEQARGFQMRYSYVPEGVLCKVHVRLYGPDTSVTFRSAQSFIGTC